MSLISWLFPPPSPPLERQPEPWFSLHQLCHPLSPLPNDLAEVRKQFMAPAMVHILCLTYADKEARQAARMFWSLCGAAPQSFWEQSKPLTWEQTRDALFSIQSLKERSAPCSPIPAVNGVANPAKPSKIFAPSNANEPGPTSNSTATTDNSPTTSNGSTKRKKQTNGKPVPQPAEPVSLKPRETTYHDPE